MKHLSSLISLYFILHSPSIAQSDTIPSDKIIHNKHNFFSFKFSQWSDPKKAAVLSAILPGAGQIYNKKYWKVPVIYTLGGLLSYNFIQQNRHYFYYKNELLKVINGGINPDGYSSQQLTLLKNQSKKWRDLSATGIILLYVLNIIDANVDAHLKKFDISDNLSIDLYPHNHLTEYVLIFRF